MCIAVENDGRKAHVGHSPYPTFLSVFSAVTKTTVAKLPFYPTRKLGSDLPPISPIYLAFVPKVGRFGD